MNSKNMKKKIANHENAYAHIPCNFGDRGVSRLGVGYLTHSIHTHIASWIILRCYYLLSSFILFLVCIPNDCTDICGSDVSTTANIRDLGVYLDCTMSMTAHVTRVCGTAYGRLRNIARIRSSLPLLACKTLVHALVTSTLDFGNAALFGISGTLLHRLEMVQRAAARVVLCIDRRDHRSMTAALRDLHWLPIALRIEFKVLTLMHGAVHNSTPLYLSDRIST